jgi:hypothetical protein
MQNDGLMGLRAAIALVDPQAAVVKPLVAIALSNTMDF